MDCILPTHKDAAGNLGRFTSIALGVGAGAVAVPLFGAQGAVIASGIPAVVAALIMLVVTRRPLAVSSLRA